MRADGDRVVDDVFRDDEVASRAARRRSRDLRHRERASRADPEIEVGVLTRGVGDGDDEVNERLVDPDLVDLQLQLEHIVRVHHRRERVERRPRRLLLDDARFVGGRRIAEFDPHEKTVELVFREEIGALEFVGILRGDHHEWGRKVMDLPLCAHCRFGHRLEERRLRPRGRAIDLVGEDDVGEDRPPPKQECAALPLQDRNPSNVRGKEIRSALDPTEGTVHAARQGLRQNRLSNPRHVLDEHMAASEQADDDPVDRLRIAQEDRREVLFERGDLLHAPRIRSPLVAQLIAVTHELHCVRCRYVLRGLPVNGTCPECGFTIMRSLVETLDIHSQALARPKHPKRIARALEAMAIGGLLWGVGTVAPLSGRLVAALLGRTVGDTISLTDQLGSLLALVGAAFAVGAFVQLARRDDPVLTSEMGFSGRWMVLGGAIWATAALAHVLFLSLRLDHAIGMASLGLGLSCLAVEVAGGSIAVIGVRRMFAVLGQRSRRYRAAAHARQSAEALAVAAAIFLVATLLSIILPSLKYEFSGMFASVIALVTGGVLLMGLIYMLVNCRWIARAILDPPPQIDEVVRVVNEGAQGEPQN